MPDLNAYTVEDAMKIVEGTARNMGVAVEGVNDKELAEEVEEAKEAELEAAKKAAKEAAKEAANADVTEVEVITEKSSEEE